MDYFYDMTKLEYIIEGENLAATQSQSITITSNIEQNLDTINLTQIPLEEAIPIIRYLWVYDFYKNFLSEALDLENFLKENYKFDANDNLIAIQTQMPSTIESEHLENANFNWAEEEIIKLDQIVEETIFYESFLQDKRLILKVMSTPEKCSINVGSEYTFALSATWNKTIGYRTSEFDEPDIYIRGPNLLTVKWENNKLFIKESTTRSPTAAISIDEIVIKDKDIFLAGNYVFEFSIIDNQTLSLNYKKRDEYYTSSRILWTSNMPVKLIGRSKKATDLTFEDDTTMSKIHAAVEFNEGNWRIYDRNSRNGLWRHLHNRKTLDDEVDSEWTEVINFSKFLFHDVIFLAKIYSI